MAAAKKGLLAKAKDAIVGVFEDKPARKSPKRVAAGKKAAGTRKVNQAVKTAKSAVKKAAKKLAPARRASSAKRAKRSA